MLGFSLLDFSWFGNRLEKKRKDDFYPKVEEELMEFKSFCGCPDVRVTTKSFPSHYNTREFINIYL